MATPHTTLSCVLSKQPVTINQTFSQLTLTLTLIISQMVLREMAELLLTEEEVVAEVVELVGEEQDSKMIEGINNLSLNNKVGRILRHLIHSRLLILHPQILVLHLQILVLHLQTLALHLQTLALHLQFLQAVAIQISTPHRVKYYITLKVSNLKI